MFQLLHSQLLSAEVVLAVLRVSVAMVVTQYFRALLLLAVAAEVLTWEIQITEPMAVQVAALVLIQALPQQESLVKEIMADLEAERTKDTVAVAAADHLVSEEIIMAQELLALEEVLRRLQ